MRARTRCRGVLHSIASVDPRQTAQFAKFWPEGVDEASFVKVPADKGVGPLGATFSVVLTVLEY